MGACARPEVRRRAIARPTRCSARVAGQRHPGRSRTRRPICGRRSSARATAATAPNYLDFYVGDTISKDRVTIDVGLRYDRQWGEALPSDDAGEPGVPDARARRLTFAGYDTPFTWNNFSPRAGVTYALDERARRSRARATAATRVSSSTGTVGVTQPELDGRLGDVPLGRSERRSLRAGQRSADRSVPHARRGGFNPANPTAVDVGQPDRSEPQGAAAPTASSPASSAN